MATAMKLLQQIYDNKKAHFIEFIRHILGKEPLGTWTEEILEFTQSLLD